MLQMDLHYEPDDTESREVFGLVLQQRRNDLELASRVLQRVVTENHELPQTAMRDMLVATIALKYTQSNSVCLACDGQVIGMGAGQQSRIQCTRIAAAKADSWYLRQHPSVLELPFREGLTRTEKDNAIDQYLMESNR